MKNPYRLLNRLTVHESRVVTLFEDHVRLPDSRDARFAWVRIVPGTLTLALNDQREVYMVKEYKYATARPSIELLGGAMEPGETPLHAAQREMKEEGGISARQWTPLGVVDACPTFVDSPNHHFLAEDLYETPHPADANEVLELIRIPLSEAVDRVMTGEITHAPTCSLVLKVAELLRRRS